MKKGKVTRLLWTKLSAVATFVLLAITLKLFTSMEKYEEWCKILMDLKRDITLISPFPRDITSNPISKGHISSKLISKGHNSNKFQFYDPIPKVNNSNKVTTKFSEMFITLALKQYYMQFLYFCVISKFAESTSTK